MVGDRSLREMIYQFEWSDIPIEITTREGKSIDSSGDIWHLPGSRRESFSLNFGKIGNQKLGWALKSYIRNRLEIVSTDAGYAMFRDVWRFFLRFNFEANDDFKNQLITIIENSISQARSKHLLYAMYRPLQWYIWCAKNYPELGFCSAYSLELEGMSVPGNPKGEAVRVEDPDKGPLHKSLELPLLIDALKRDGSNTLEHLQEKAVVALSIAFGRNPYNLTFLREGDLVDMTPEGDVRCYVIKMPRIKKRQITPRDNLLEEHLDSFYASFLIDLIDANIKLDIKVESGGKTIKTPLPIFVKTDGNRAAILSQDWDNVYNMTSRGITKLLKSFVIRHNIISPLTGKSLQINSRRLRYTLATGLASEGISKRELARILDHTDTQHVQVYFEMAGNVIEHLDKASAKGFSRYLDFFKGKVISNDDEAVNGDRDDKHLIFINEEDPSDHSDIGICGESKICHLDPPYSCYLCPKFQPYRHADHEHVLDCLLQGREERLEKYENARLGIQLDQVIAAVAQVAELCTVEAADV